MTSFMRSFPYVKTPISGGEFFFLQYFFAPFWPCNSIPWVLMHSAIHIHTLHYLPWEALNSNWFVAYTDKTQLVCPSAEWVQTRSLFLPENFSFFTCPLLYGWENLNYENNWDTVQPIYRGYAHRTVTLSNNWFTI